MIAIQNFIHAHTIGTLGFAFAVSLLAYGVGRNNSLRRLPQALALIALVLLVCELSLRWLDPWGAWAYQQNLATIFRNAEAHPTRGYTMTAGEFQWYDGTPVTLAAAGRWVPASQPAPCRIAVLGDSVSFGFAVGDDAVYVNHLAERFPGVQWVNMAVSGYDHTALRQLFDETPADGYLYLMINNDLTEAGLMLWQPDWPNAWPGSALRAYGGMFLKKLAPPPAVDPSAWADLSFVERPDVLAFATDSTLPSLEAARVYFGSDLVTIPAPDETISFADGHPSAAGHAQLAASMEPYVKDWLPTVCGAVAEQ